jgi:hypothetical protein
MNSGYRYRRMAADSSGCRSGHSSQRSLGADPTAQPCSGVEVVVGVGPAAVRAVSAALDISVGEVVDADAVQSTAGAS